MVLVEAFRDATQGLQDWLFQSALPLWWEKGGDVAGGFHELLTRDGVPSNPVRRARVQARQSYVYAQAGLMGWDGPWQLAALHGVAYLDQRYRMADGQYCTLVSEAGRVLDADTYLYDQAFALLAMATLMKAMPERRDLAASAHALMDRVIASRRHAPGGFVECGEKPFLSNPHMHLLEAMLAWHDVEPQGRWGALADQIAGLCLEKFIDPSGGFLREYFDADWSPAFGPDGHVVEPGHQFEWAWLLMRWGRLRGHPEIHGVVLKLFDNGCKGIDPARDAAIHAMDDVFRVTVPTARLWAQTERIKAALALYDGGDDRFLKEALAGAHALRRYLDTQLAGLWYDQWTADGVFVDAPSPASSFYHIICCIACMRDAAGR